MTLKEEVEFLKTQIRRLGSIWEVAGPCALECKLLADWLESGQPWNQFIKELNEEYEGGKGIRPYTKRIRQTNYESIKGLRLNRARRPI